MYSEGDRARTIVSLAAARSWRDPEYRARLVAEPKAVLADEGLELEDYVEVRVLEDTETLKYLPLTRGTADAAEALDAIRPFIPLAEGCELRIVQSTERLRYLVLPTMSGNVTPAVSERELARAASRGVTHPDTVEVEVEVDTTTTVSQTATSVTSIGAAAEAAAAVVAVAVAVLS